MRLKYFRVWAYNFTTSITYFLQILKYPILKFNQILYNILCFCWYYSVFITYNLNVKYMLNKNNQLMSQTSLSFHLKLLKFLPWLDQTQLLNCYFLIYLYKVHWNIKKSLKSLVKGLGVRKKLLVIWVLT